MSSRLSLGTYALLGLRNLWRNPKRTGLTLAAFIVGIGSLTFLVAIDDGWLFNMKDNFILTQTGHVQVHRQGFQDSRRVQDYIAKPDKVMRLLEGDARIQAVSQRVRISGLASVAGANTGVQVMGVDPVAEAGLSRLSTFVREGAWLEESDNRGLLLGVTLAEHLHTGLGDKIVLMAQAPNSDLVSEVFRLRGILQSGAPAVDQSLALISLPMAQQWLGIGEGVTDVVIRAFEHDMADGIQADLRAQLPPDQYEMLRWVDIDPMIQQWAEMADASTYFILMIVVGIVLVEVLNTMLMSMHERIREFGLMESVGTGKLQLFAMMMWETVILVMIGGLLGYLLGAAVSLHYASTGINISDFAEAFTFMYMDPVVHPILTMNSAAKIIGVTLSAALLAGLYPAWRATRLNPVSAMREV